MMNWTDKHCRYFYRILSKKVQLYTEMINSKAILYGDKNYLLDYNAKEHPLVLQLGGSDAAEMAECAAIAQSWGYDSVNINVGCPSKRVSYGKFGACLMKEPELLGSCVEAMMNNCNIPVSVKSRIGVDDMNNYSELSDFIKNISNRGCDNFIIHARKALLGVLSPKDNRTIPPLKHSWVYKLKEDFPHLNISINGGIDSIVQIKKHLQYVDGVMLGRTVYHKPYLLAEIDNQFYNEDRQKISRREVLMKYIEYIKINIEKGIAVHSMSRHILGLYSEQKNAKLFRRMLSAKSTNLNTINNLLDIVVN